MIKEAIQILEKKENLSAVEMETVMEEIMSGGADTPSIVSFLTVLTAKGESVEEITAAVGVMRRHATRIKCDKQVILDTCGTGGDGACTFNVSTACALVVSASGVTVAKHGNRSVSSRCGSADILEALGINIHMDVKKIEECLLDIGIAFLFAQNLHPAMKYAMPARKQIGRRTIFNILGPLSNPAGATHQLIGVYNKHWVGILSEVLQNLGSIHTLIVHGEDGLDEVTTTAKTLISESHKGTIKNYEIAPEDFGLKRTELRQLMGTDAKTNARMVLDVLGGEQGARRDIVLLNSAAAIYTADKASSIKEALAIAGSAIDSGAALKKLQLLKERSNL